MANSTWEDSMYVDVFRLAKSGLSDTAIAKSIGVTPKTFMQWKKNKKALRKALQDGRVPSGEVSRNFQDYVYMRLPKRLRKVWKKIQQCSETNQIVKMERLLDKQGRVGRQQLFIHALISSNFNASEACRLVNIPYNTLQRWIQTDPDFGELLNEMELHKLDFFENAFIQKVAEGDTKAILFAMKSKLHSRGYGETKRIEKNVNVQGMIGHMPVSLDDLGLSLEAKKEILEKVRSKTDNKQLGPAHKELVS